MPVPEIVHVLARGKGLTGMSHQKRQEAAVSHLQPIGVGARPALSFFRVHQLELDRVEVERANRCDDLLNGSN